MSASSIASTVQSVEFRRSLSFLFVEVDDGLQLVRYRLVFILYWSHDLNVLDFRPSCRWFLKEVPSLIISHLLQLEERF